MLQRKWKYCHCKHWFRDCIIQLAASYNDVLAQEIQKLTFNLTSRLSNGLSFVKKLPSLPKLLHALEFAQTRNKFQMPTCTI